MAGHVLMKPAIAADPRLQPRRGWGPRRPARRPGRARRGPARSDAGRVVEVLERVPDDDRVLERARLELGLVDADVRDLDPGSRGRRAGGRRGVDPAGVEAGGAHRGHELAVAGADLEHARARARACETKRIRSRSARPRSGATQPRGEPARRARRCRPRTSPRGRRRRRPSRPCRRPGSARARTRSRPASCGSEAVAARQCAQRRRPQAGQGDPRCAHAGRLSRRRTRAGSPGRSRR